LLDLAELSEPPDYPVDVDSSLHHIMEYVSVRTESFVRAYRKCTVADVERSGAALPVSRFLQQLFL
jgi:hypothetical protein